MDINNRNIILIINFVMLVYLILFNIHYIKSPITKLIYYVKLPLIKLVYHIPRISKKISKTTKAP